MPETKLIPSITSYTVIGSNISILTEYNPLEEPLLIQAFIATEAGSLSGVSYSEGDLVMDIEGFPDTMNVQLNEQGELIFISPKADLYSIDQNTGELIYSEP